MIIADASTAGPLWWPAAAALDSVLAGDIAVYRDTWGVTDMTTTLGHEPAANSHHQHAQWQTLQLRLDHVRRRDLDGNGRDDHADVFDRDGNGIDDQVDFELAERVATLHERVTNWRVVAAAPSVGIDDWRSREPHHQLDRSFER